MFKSIIWKRHTCCKLYSIIQLYYTLYSIILYRLAPKVKEMLWTKFGVTLEADLFSLTKRFCCFMGICK